MIEKFVYSNQKFISNFYDLSIYLKKNLGNLLIKSDTLHINGSRIWQIGQDIIFLML